MAGKTPTIATSKLDSSVTFFSKLARYAELINRYPLLLEIDVNPWAVIQHMKVIRECIARDAAKYWLHPVVKRFFLEKGQPAYADVSVEKPSEEFISKYDKSNVKFNHR